MTIASFLVFLIPTATGALIIHLLWPERRGMALLLKLSLGIGLGLGLNSIIHFLFLQIAPGQQNTPAMQLGLLAFLIIVALLRECKGNQRGLKFPAISRFHWILLSAVILAATFSLLAFINLTEARPQGVFDAWSIWNRAARFIYRDPENWTATVSPDLYWGSHPDYPLLIPLNVAWGWTALGTETQRIPMMQSALFMFACAALIFAAVGLMRTLGQASLVLLVLLGTSKFMVFGYGQIADVPLTFFILATCVLMFSYFVWLSRN